MFRKAWDRLISDNIESEVSLHPAPSSHHKGNYIAQEGIPNGYPAIHDSSCQILYSFFFQLFLPSEENVDEALPFREHVQ